MVDQFSTLERKSVEPMALEVEGVRYRRCSASSVLSSEMQSICAGRTIISAMTI